MAILVAFLCTLVSGLSTSIGGLIALLAKKTNKVFLSVSLGFSAGVMIYVSMIEIFQEANTSLTQALGEVKGSWLTVIAFFGGMMLIAFVLGIVLQLLVIEVGAVSKMFSTCNLSLYDWGLALLFGLTPLVIHEIVVLINKIRIKK